MKTILIADPSELFTEALSQALAPRFHVHICHNGIDALRLLQELRPDILILQLNLPYIDGLTVLRDSYYKAPITIVLTTIVTDDVINAASAIGVQDLILIPCTVKHVVEHLESLQRIPSAD